MSLTNALLNELSPIFRVLEDPFFSADPFALVPRPQSYNHRRHHPQRQLTSNSGGLSSELGIGEFRTPRVQVAEEENKYVVQAEVPGVRKEDLDVSIGDGGRSLRIQGASSSTSGPAAQARANGVPAQGQAGTSAPTGAAEGDKQTEAVAQRPADNQVAVTQSAPQRWSSFSFSRTIWLPEPVDPANINAKLDHGILTLEIQKKPEGPDTQKIHIN